MISEFKSNLLVKTKNNLLINEDDINALKKYDINVDDYKTINELLYKIDDIINNEDLESDEIEELDYIANTLQERNYYMNFKK
ncbi:MAG: hypothetical protein IJ572_04470 [Bacilli bacterium]|nr:hypothetical protein [Bacilli bacterium]